ncbi:MAG TPA: hypothetical protein VFQ22_00750 [Longimicrobiales bacterium]|nr:hypothetical protein [Longimicrobiales bacterium]
MDPGRDTERVYAASAGHPLFALELARARDPKAAAGTLASVATTSPTT